jgi:GT2 family glycosyltransferase
MVKLSVVIPSYKDPLLQKTIDSLLENSELGDQLEIVVVFDGYWANPPLLFSEENNKRVKQLHLGKNRGMRGAINAGVQVATGEFLMRTDEHCVFDKGYDRKLTERFKDDWICYPKRYYLDTEKWEVMDKEPNVYNKLIIDKSRHKFSGVNWKSRELERPGKMIDESMAMQGSCWVMKRSWWDAVIKELQTEGYGPHYGDSHEMVFKTWQAGGRLMVNKSTWYAHKDRSFPRTHNTGSAESAPGWAYSIKVWGDYYHNTVKPKWNI